MSLRTKKPSSFTTTAFPCARSGLYGIDGKDGLESIVFGDGSQLARAAMFFDTAVAQQSDLASRLGCELTTSGTAKVDAVA